MPRVQISSKGSNFTLHARAGDGYGVARYNKSTISQTLGLQFRKKKNKSYTGVATRWKIYYF